MAAGEPLRERRAWGAGSDPALTCAPRAGFVSAALLSSPHTRFPSWRTSPGRSEPNLARRAPGQGGSALTWHSLRPRARPSAAPPAAGPARPVPPGAGARPALGPALRGGRPWRERLEHGRLEMAPPGPLPETGRSPGAAAAALPGRSGNRGCFSPLWLPWEGSARSLALSFPGKALAQLPSSSCRPSLAHGDGWYRRPSQCAAPRDGAPPPAALGTQRSLLREGQLRRNAGAGRGAGWVPGRWHPMHQAQPALSGAGGGSAAGTGPPSAPGEGRAVCLDARPPPSGNGRGKFLLCAPRPSVPPSAPAHSRRHTRSHPHPAASGRGALLKALLVPHPAAADIIPAGGRAEAPPPPPDGRSPGELPAGPRPWVASAGRGARGSGAARGERAASPARGGRNRQKLGKIKSKHLFTTKHVSFRWLRCCAVARPAGESGPGPVEPRPRCLAPGVGERDGAGRGAPRQWVRAGPSQQKVRCLQGAVSFCSFL